MANNDGTDDFDPVRSITMYITDFDINHLLNEAVTRYMQEQTLELQQEIKMLKKSKETIQRDNRILETTLQQLRKDNDSIKQSVELLPTLNANTRELIDYKHNEMEEWKTKCNASIQEFKKQSEDQRKNFADITPQYGEYQKAKAKALVSGIRLKMVEKELEEQKEKEMLRKKVNNHLRNQKIVNFARACLDYYKRDESISKSMVNLNDPRKEAAKAQITSSAVELEQLTAACEIPMYNYRNKDLNQISTVSEVPQIKWDEVTLRIKKTMKEWMTPSTPSFRSLQNIKRPIGDAGGKINIISNKKIKEAAATPLAGTCSEVGPKINMVESRKQSVITSAFFNNPKANMMNGMSFQTNTNMLSPPNGNLMPPPGNLMSPPGNLPPLSDLMPPKGNLMPPTGNLMPPNDNLMPPAGNLMPPNGNLMPPMGNLMSPPGNLMPSTGILMPPNGNLMPPTGNLTSPPSTLMPPKGNLIPPTANLMQETRNLFDMSMGSAATPYGDYSFNEDRFMMMSPSGSVDMEMPSFNVGADYSNSPSFMANRNQPSTNDQPGPMSLFTNAGSNPFNMFN